ncbi:LysR substrate-binding domain-containing protein [Alteromonas aestuariivivens]|nr:LysR substrate-binding domain-containing protein [Alteromonas aestuariivivens]
MNSLTFRLLEVFRHVVDCGSVTAASSSLSLSQPTVSLQLKKLSAIIGIPLLEHVHGQVIMTDAGKALYEYAQTVLSAQQKLDSRIHAIRGMQTGSLNLAVVSTAQYVVPPFLSQFCHEHPNIEVNFTVGNRAQVIERLRQNLDDLYVFSHPPEDSSLMSAPFMQNRLVVIAPSSYSGPDHCSLESLCGQKFLLREPGSGTRRSLQTYCEPRNITFANVVVMESNEAIQAAVAAGLGLAIISEHTLTPASSEQIRILTVQDFPLNAQWHVVTTQHRPMNLAAQAFRSTLLASTSGFHTLPVNHRPQ